MASSVSGDQSLSLFTSIGRTITRLSLDSFDEQGAMAMPSIIMAESGERIAITDGDVVETSEDVSPLVIIVDAVMKISHVKPGGFWRHGCHGFIRLERKVKISSSGNY